MFGVHRLLMYFKDPLKVANFNDTFLKYIGSGHNKGLFNQLHKYF
jgi:hypothetical protein